MEQKATEATKKCPHCQQEISIKAKRCPHCHGDLRNWFIRHKILSVLLALILVILVGNALNRAIPSQASDSTSSTPSLNDRLSQNHPTIKELATLPRDYVGKSFTLYVNAQDDRYYNYGFSDENKYYSLELWDNSVSGEFEGVYGYLAKTPENQTMINLALNSPLPLKVKVSVPADKWQDGSNAFLQIDSWQYLDAQ